MPIGIKAAEGLTAIAVNAADVTVTVAEPLTFAALAEIVDWPVATLLAKPAALMVATAIEAELQVTEFVKFRVLPSA